MSVFLGHLADVDFGNLYAAETPVLEGPVAFLSINLFDGRSVFFLEITAGY